MAETPTVLVEMAASTTMSRPVQLARSDEATELYRALRDALWDLDQRYVTGAHAIVANAVHKYQQQHPEVGRS